MNYELTVNGLFYKRGEQFSVSKYEELVMSYKEITNKNDETPSERSFATLHSISRTTVRKVRDFVNGSLTSFHTPRRIQKYKEYGKYTLNEDAKTFLIYVYRQDPRSPLLQYQNMLFMYNGKRVSTSTICRFFKYSLLYKSSMRKTSIFPHLKYTMNNIIKLNKYINFISTINPYRLVFTDEKPLQGGEIFKAPVRRDPLTGETPTVTSTIKIKNKFNLMAAVKCSSANEHENIAYQIGKFKGNSFMFKEFVLNMVRTNFLQEGDILVCDNATIHTRQECRYLHDELWEYASVFVILLPAYHPELNPIELVFNVITQRLRHSNARYIDYVNKQDDKIIQVCCDILNNITTMEIKKMYQKCGYLHLL